MSQVEPLAGRGYGSFSIGKAKILTSASYGILNLISRFYEKKSALIDPAKKGLSQTSKHFSFMYMVGWDGATTKEWQHEKGQRFLYIKWNVIIVNLYLYLIKLFYIYALLFRC